jgi:uridine phosphorylase
MFCYQVILDVANQFPASLITHDMLQLIANMSPTQGHWMGSRSQLLQELVKCGADTFIRVGTSGHIQKDIHSGELAIITAAIRDEGTSRHYMPIEFPAIADIDIVIALQAAAKKTGAKSRTGITQSKDSFYGQHEPERMGVAKDLLERWRAWEIGGALCSEMEASALFVIASMLRVRAGGVMMVHGKEPMPPLDILLQTAVQGLREMIANDRASGRSVTL